MSKRLFPVRPAMRIHLQQAEVHSQLYFFLAIFADELPHHHLAGLIVPLVQEM
jgi:hypothetical protein